MTINRNAAAVLLISLTAGAVLAGAGSPLAIPCLVVMGLAALRLNSDSRKHKDD